MGESASAKLTRQLRLWASSHSLRGVTPEQALHAVAIWVRLHGLLTLEIEGNFRSMGIDPRLIFESTMADLLTPHRHGET